jgi:hypothetical protein
VCNKDIYMKGAGTAVHRLDFLVHCFSSHFLSKCLTHALARGARRK